MLNSTSKDCADIFVMGIKKKYHRMGLGTKLNTAYEAMAKKLGYSYSQVKTVKMGHYKEYTILPIISICLWGIRNWNAFRLYGMNGTLAKFISNILGRNNAFSLFDPH